MAAINLTGKKGRLVDIEIQWVLEQADQYLASSKPLSVLRGDMGAPAELSVDVARWQPPGFEVTLQRSSTWSKGESAPRIEYNLRARTSIASSAAPETAAGDAKKQEDAKRREEAK